MVAADWTRVILPEQAKGRKYGKHVHRSGFYVDHCGHPTAHRPYTVQTPSGQWIGRLADQTRKGRPMGLVFQYLAEAKAWIESHVQPTVELTDEGELLHGWALVLPADWEFLPVTLAPRP